MLIRLSFQSSTCRIPLRSPARVFGRGLRSLPCEIQIIHVKCIRMPHTYLIRCVMFVGISVWGSQLSALGKDDDDGAAAPVGASEHEDLPGLETLENVGIAHRGGVGSPQHVA